MKGKTISCLTTPAGMNVVSYSMVNALGVIYSRCTYNGVADTGWVAGLTASHAAGCTSTTTANGVIGTSTFNATTATCSAFWPLN